MKVSTVVLLLLMMMMMLSGYHSNGFVDISERALSHELPLEVRLTAVAAAAARVAGRV